MFCSHVGQELAQIKLIRAGVFMDAVQMIQIRRSNLRHDVTVLTSSFILKYSDFESSVGKVVTK